MGMYVYLINSLLRAMAFRHEARLLLIYRYVGIMIRLLNFYAIIMCQIIELWNYIKLYTKKTNTN